MKMLMETIAAQTDAQCVAVVTKLPIPSKFTGTDNALTGYGGSLVHKLHYCITNHSRHLDS